MSRARKAPVGLKPQRRPDSQGLSINSSKQLFSPELPDPLITCKTIANDFVPTNIQSPPGFLPDKIGTPFPKSPPGFLPDKIGTQFPKSPPGFLADKIGTQLPKSPPGFLPDKIGTQFPKVPPGFLPDKMGTHVTFTNVKPPPGFSPKEIDPFKVTKSSEGPSVTKMAKDSNSKVLVLPKFNFGADITNLSGDRFKEVGDASSGKSNFKFNFHQEMSTSSSKVGSFESIKPHPSAFHFTFNRSQESVSGSLRNSDCVNEEGQENAIPSGIKRKFPGIRTESILHYQKQYGRDLLGHKKPNNIYRDPLNPLSSDSHVADAERNQRTEYGSVVHRRMCFASTKQTSQEHLNVDICTQTNKLRTTCNRVIFYSRQQLLVLSHVKSSQQKPMNWREMLLCCPDVLVANPQRLAALELLNEKATFFFKTIIR